MLKIRRPLGRLIFNMGIAIPGKTVFLIETAPCWGKPLMSDCRRVTWSQTTWLISRHLPVISWQHTLWFKSQLCMIYQITISCQKQHASSDLLMLSNFLATESNERKCFGRTFLCTLCVCIQSKTAKCGIFSGYNITLLYALLIDIPWMFTEDPGNMISGCFPRVSWTWFHRTQSPCWIETAGLDPSITFDLLSCFGHVGVACCVAATCHTK